MPPPGPDELRYAHTAALTVGLALTFSIAGSSPLAVSRYEGSSQAPAAPTGLTVSPSGTTVTLTWLAPAGLDDVTSYVIEAGSSSGASNLANFDTGGTSTTMTVQAVPPGTYFVRVRARHATGLSAPSNEAILSVGGSPAPCTPAAPTRLRHSDASLASTTTFTWTAPAGDCAPTAYVLEGGSVWGASNLGVITTGNTLTSMATGPLSRGDYFVRVRARNGTAISSPSNEVLLSVGTPGAPTCGDVGNVDAFGGIPFITGLDPIPHACRIVTAAEGHPVHDGSQSVRFELHASDCQGSGRSPDCLTDRSRYEIRENNRGATSDGKVVTYEEWIYIPPQPRFRPQGGNILFLTQIQFLPSNGENAQEAGGYTGVLAYLEVAEDGALRVRSQVDVKSDTSGIYRFHPLMPNPVGRWTKIVWEIGGSTQANGFLRVYADDVLKIDEVKPTIPLPGWRHSLKIGIYNAFRSQSSEPFDTQVVYFDGIRTSVR